MSQIKRALISVSDKTGIVDFAKELQNLNIEILSTGGTFKLLHENNIPVVKIEDYIEFPEILDGRVKTLNPRIHGGILAMRSNEKHKKQLQELNIKEIDLVVVNLYPFEKVTANPDVTLEDAIENIDIGGNTLIRASAKNYQDVSVICDQTDYEPFMQMLKESKGHVTKEFNFSLAKKALLRTAEYDMVISEFLNNFENPEPMPQVKFLKLEKNQKLRYGENSHQKAAFYHLPKKELLSNIQQLHGKELSFNNIVDFNSAFEMTYALKQNFQKPGVVILKHTNPCGAALGETLKEAYTKALSTDPVSAFGSIVGVTEELDKETAQKIKNLFVEVVLAPSFSQKALDILTQKKNIRLIVSEDLNKKDIYANDLYDIKKVRGGILLQEYDNAILNKFELATKADITEQDKEELKFSWLMCKFVKSNAIVYSKNFQLIGVGAGQMSRVDSAELGITKAQKSGLDIKGSYMASDAFFPFRDSIDAAAKAGIKAIIQPGGSIRDEEVITAANEHNIPMLFTGMRHFRH